MYSPFYFYLLKDWDCLNSGLGFLFYILFDDFRRQSRDRRASFVLHCRLYCVFYVTLRTCIAQSVQRLATGWTVRGSNPGGGEIFRTRPYRAWGQPNLLYNGYRIFAGGKAARAWP